MRISDDMPALVTTVLQSVQSYMVRRRIISQLMESLLYEGVLQPTAVEQDKGQLVFLLQGWDEQGQAVTYRCCGERKFSFGRLRLRREPVTRITHAGSDEVKNIPLLLAELSPAMQVDRQLLINLSQELQQTWLNDSIAQYLRQYEQRTMRGQTYDDLERETMDGHPYHPSYKSRMGFDLAHNLAYGPEFGPHLSPLWLAVRRDRCAVVVSQQMNMHEFLAGELGEALYTCFVEQIRSSSEDPEQYLLLPVHPWQWQQKIVPLLMLDIQCRHIIPLLQYHQNEAHRPLDLTPSDLYRPQQSIRTLANITAPRKTSLKLSLSIINTSTGRILAPHTVRNAPLISDWLHSILAEDSFLRDELRCVLLAERCGISYLGGDVGKADGEGAPTIALLRQQSYGILACIWRESLHTYVHLENGEEAVPFSSLVHLAGDGSPFIHPWMQHPDIEEWLKTLLHVAITPLIHLLYAHGIALEAHAQNMVLVQRDGMPQYVVFKDFHDGIRFSRQHLTAPQRCPPLVPTPEEHARVNRNSFVETSDPLLVRDFMLDAFFFINLAELAIFLHEHYGFSEGRFWSLAREVIERYQRRFAHLQERFVLFDICTPTFSVEQLTRRRLLPESELRLHEVSNPLADARHTAS
jgi:siderophore synthetase component